jgi:hypothetical protein
MLRAAFRLRPASPSSKHAQQVCNMGAEVHGSFAGRDHHPGIICITNMLNNTSVNQHPSPSEEPVQENLKGISP